MTEIAPLRRRMIEIRRLPDLIRSVFRAPSLSYIDDWKSAS